MQVQKADSPPSNPSLIPPIRLRHTQGQGVSLGKLVAGQVKALHSLTRATIQRDALWASALYKPGPYKYLLL